MKEYRVMQQFGDGRPFYYLTFKTFEGAFSELLRLIALHKQGVNKKYFVLNDFYKNEFPSLLNDMYKLWIEYREVDEWKMSTGKEKENKKSNNIVYLNYKRSRK